MEGEGEKKEIRKMKVSGNVGKRGREEKAKEKGGKA